MPNKRDETSGSSDTSSQDSPVSSSLACLLSLDRLTVEQVDIGMCVKSENRYEITDRNGHRVFTAVASCDTVCCCPDGRPNEVTIRDNKRRKVILINRPNECCRMDYIEVATGDSHYLGMVARQCTLCVPSYKVQDVTGKTVYYIEGRYCACECSEVNFDILTPDRVTKVGLITRDTSGCCTTSNVFQVRFGGSSSVKHKALLLSAAFLINFVKVQQKRDRRNLILLNNFNRLLR